MSTQPEETAIPGLRAQILGKHPTPSGKCSSLTTLCPCPDNLRLIKYETEDPVITTACSSKGWCAAIFNKHSGYPIYGTREGESTVVAALRNLLRYTFEIAENKFQEFRDDSAYHDHRSWSDTGVEFKVSCVAC